MGIPGRDARRGECDRAFGVDEIIDALFPLPVRPISTAGSIFASKGLPWLSWRLGRATGSSSNAALRRLG
jgi:hypothetical protein